MESLRTKLESYISGDSKDIGDHTVPDFSKEEMSPCYKAVMSCISRSERAEKDGKRHLPPSQVLPLLL